MSSRHPPRSERLSPLWAARFTLSARCDSLVTAGWSSQGARQPHKLEDLGSNPSPAIAMQLVSYTGRPRPLFWVELQACRALIEGHKVAIVASSREQAERTFSAAKSLLNGSDPRGTAPG